VIGPFLSIEVLCGLARGSNGWHNWRLDREVWGNVDYWMGRKGSGLI
jgi:hypothetical protein